MVGRPHLLLLETELKPLLVVVLCGGLALVLSLFFRDGPVKPAVPATFFLLIISLAHFCGRLASLLVAIADGLVFAPFLFEPSGSLAVCNAAGRLVLFWFALCGIAAVCLSTKPDTRFKQILFAIVTALPVSPPCGPQWPPPPEAGCMTLRAKKTNGAPIRQAQPRNQKQSRKPRKAACCSTMRASCALA
jgi:hypothetical protein